MSLMEAQLEADQPLYFGDGGELFGIFQAAQAVTEKAVLLCPPLGQEQIRCHRLYRQLAHALAADGISVLRFDYYGCGDSAGASDQVDWDRCIADSQAAANELRLRSGAEHIVAFGARLGGNIVLAAALEARFAEVLVWDPVVDGQQYVARMDALQIEICQDLGRFSMPRKRTDLNDQWSGFAVSERLREQLATLQPVPVSVPTIVFDSVASTVPGQWGGLGIDYRQVRKLEQSTPWEELERMELAILSRPLIDAVVARVRGPT